MKSGYNTNQKSQFISLILALLVLALPIDTLISQDVVILEEVQVQEEAQDGEPDDEMDEEDEGEAAVMPAMAFGMPSKAKMLAAKQFELRQVFAIHIDEIKTLCKLDAKQAKRLEIASKGVLGAHSRKWVKRFMDQFGGAFMGNPNAGDDEDDKEKEDEDDEEIVEINDASEIDATTSQMMMQDASPFQKGLKGPLKSKLWVKALKATLSKEQHELIQNHYEKRQKRNREITLEFLISQITRDVLLTEEQTTIVRDKLKPAIEKMEDYLGGMFDSYILMYVASTIEDEELNKVLSKPQFQRWKLFVGPYAQFGDMLGQEMGEADMDDSEDDDSEDDDSGAVAEAVKVDSDDELDKEKDDK